MSCPSVAVLAVIETATRRARAVREPAATDAFLDHLDDRERTP